MDMGKVTSKVTADGKQLPSPQIIEQVGAFNRFISFVKNQFSYESSTDTCKNEDKIDASIRTRSSSIVKPQSSLAIDDGNDFIASNGQNVSFNSEAVTEKVSYNSNSSSHINNQTSFVTRFLKSSSSSSTTSSTPVVSEKVQDSKSSIMPGQTGSNSDKNTEQLTSLMTNSGGGINHELSAMSNVTVQLISKIDEIKAQNEKTSIQFLAIILLWLLTAITVVILVVLTIVITHYLAIALGILILGFVAEHYVGFMLFEKSCKQRELMVCSALLKDFLLSYQSIEATIHIKLQDAGF